MDRHFAIVDGQDQRNALNRAKWTLKYFGGRHCPDYRTVKEIVQFESWYSPARHKAIAFLSDEGMTFELNRKHRYAFLPHPVQQPAKVLPFVRKPHEHNG